MGLSATMWTSVSGLLAHGDKMNVVGNNIANVSTIGFKGQRMDFNDYLYINGGSTSGPTQIGAGVANYAVIGDFSQGTLESTNSVTDIAIDGNGFFKVRQPNTDQMYYTRAGDFYFNADRQLQNPEGYRLQGWKIDNSTRLTFKNDSVNLGENPTNESAFQGTGTPVDIVLDSWYLEPQRTSSVSFTMGLTSDGNSDRSTSTNSPMTALFDQWDASKNPPMADSSYATSSSIKVYDEGGTAHTLTVYYDQVATKGNSYEIQGLPAGYTMYEYVVTIPPEEDMRTYGGKGYNPETNEWATEPTSFYNPDPDVCNKNAGMLMTGHLIFDTAGNLVNQTAYTFGGSTADMGDGNQYSGNPANLSSWEATRFSSNGLPVFTANFTGQPLANTVNETAMNGKSQAQDFIIELDLGLRNLGGKTSDWSATEGLSLQDLQTKAVTTTDVKYITAPELPRLYDPDNTYYFKDQNDKYQAAYVDEDGNKWRVKTDADGNMDPGADGKPQIEGKLPDGEVLYTKTMEDRTTSWDKLLDGTEHSETDTPKYTVQDPNDPTKTYIVGWTKDKEIKLYTDDNPPVALTKNQDGTYTTTTPNGESKNFYATDIGTINYQESVAHVTHGTPQFPTDMQSQVLYRDSNGQYREAMYLDTTDNQWKLNPEVEENPDQSFYLATNATVTNHVIDYNKIPTFADAQRMENATQAGSSSFITQDASQNGYASGILSGTNITADGVVYGYYDNGETVPLYQIALYDFHNQQGLRREGGNLYAATKESGEARQGVAGEAGFGVTRAYNIEGSNVDLSREFVNMITTQRGFQANSKGITTVDTMLETVIGMKR